MTEFSRYAVYYAPRPGDFARAAAEWLGRDPETGNAVAQPALEGLAALTSKPRKYGFHGTLRPPFHLPDGESPASVADAVAGLAATLSPARCEAMRVQNRYGFGLALAPASDETEILNLAARVVEGMDHLRAPLSPDEGKKRMTQGITIRQRELMERWGYPWVMEQLSFQLTLTNPIAPQSQPNLKRAIESHFHQKVPNPFVIEDLCLFGEESLSGCLRMIQRFPLLG